MSTPGSTTHAAELKENPLVDARTLRTLPAHSALTVLERQGGWLRVRVAGDEGWVRLLSVRTSSAGPAVGAEVQAVAGLATGRSGTGNIVATSGIRGLDEERLRGAMADPEQLERMESYRVSKQDAARYAAEHGLAPRVVAYLSAPRSQP